MDSGGSSSRILITGAAGNLGSRLSRHLLSRGTKVRMTQHRKPLPGDLVAMPDAEVVGVDLADPRTLPAAVAGIDTVVHFAGRLFAPQPERFLPMTNTGYFRNLLHAACAANVSRLILISFPHVEGPTSPEHPASGRLDGSPISTHARTRLAEEILLFERTAGTATTPVVLRLGAVYGRGILMVEAARRLARLRLLAVWREPTIYQLISTDDAMRAMEAAAVKPGVSGIYHVGDERPVTLQEFLDAACAVWGYPRPRRVPFPAILAAAAACEAFAAIFRTASPLTRDFVRLGRVSHWGDTGRFRRELIPQLRYRSLDEGIGTLKA